MLDSKPFLPVPPLSNHPVDVGQRSEGAILAHLIRRGYSVLVPFGVNQRYDLVLDIEGELLRVQCKTGRLRDGTVRFRTESSRINTKGAFTRSYRGEADLFLVYCPDNDRTYAVPVDDAPPSQMCLRIEPSRNGQSVGTHPAERFELPG